MHFEKYTRNTVDYCKIKQKNEVVLRSYFHIYFTDKQLFH
jgi:hypothetical protein